MAPTAIQLKIYNMVLGSGQVRNVLSGGGSHALALITLLKKVCNTPGLLLKQTDDVSLSAMLLVRPDGFE